MNNISPVNGYNIKYREAEKLKSDVEEFLSNKKNGISAITKSKNHRTDNIATVMNRNNFKSAKDRDERLKVQRPYFLEFYEVFKEKAWSTLNKEINNIVSAQHLYCVFDGRNSIANADKFEKIKSAMRKLIDNVEVR